MFSTNQKISKISAIYFSCLTFYIWEVHHSFLSKVPLLFFPLPLWRLFLHWLSIWSDVTQIRQLSLYDALLLVVWSVFSSDTERYNHKWELLWNQCSLKKPKIDKRYGKLLTHSCCEKDKTRSSCNWHQHNIYCYCHKTNTYQQSLLNFPRNVCCFL